MPRRKLTQGAIAEALGISQARVSQLSRRGMPTNDVERARAWRDANLQPAMVAGHARDDTESAPVAHAPPEASPPGANHAYFEARAKRETAEAALAELELAQKRGDLVDRAGVARAAMAAGRLMRDMLLAVPPKIASELAAIDSPNEVETRLAAELRRVLADIARLSAGGTIAPGPFEHAQ